MSWDTFKKIMKPYMDNPNGVKSKEDFAKQFTLAYDTAMKLGSVTTRGFGGSPLPIAKGNTEVMEKLMISACTIALTKSETGKHTWLNDIGQAVLGYWAGATLVQIPPLIPAIGSFQNIALTSGLVSNPGKWPDTRPEQPIDASETFLNLFIIYAQVHLTSIQFSCSTISLYFGFPLIPPLPGFINLTGYTLTPAPPSPIVVEAPPVDLSSIDTLLLTVEELLKIIPDNNNTVAGAASVVAATGTEILTDDGEPPNPALVAIQRQSTPDVTPDLSGVADEIVPLENTTEPIPSQCGIGLNYDAQLSPNLKVRSLSLDVTFPHKIKAAHGRTVDDIVCNLKHVAVNIVEPIMAKYPNVKINSAFRGTPSLVGKVSQHEIGEAIDIQFTGISPKDYLPISKWIVETLPFDQFIFEHGNSIWLHISCSRTKPNRKKKMTMINKKYESGIKCYY
jgi:hypothetical protein